LFLKFVVTSPTENHYRGEMREDSDIDLAVFSEAFGPPDYRELSGVLSRAKREVEPMIEAIGYHFVFRRDCEDGEGCLLNDPTITPAASPVKAGDNSGRLTIAVCQLYACLLLFAFLLLATSNPAIPTMRKTIPIERLSLPAHPQKHALFYLAPGARHLSSGASMILLREDRCPLATGRFPQSVLRLPLQQMRLSRCELSRRLWKRDGVWQKPVFD
jgi:hypothetical protein